MPLRLDRGYESPLHAVIQSPLHARGRKSSDFVVAAVHKTTGKLLVSIYKFNAPPYVSVSNFVAVDSAVKPDYLGVCGLTNKSIVVSWTPNYWDRYIQQVNAECAANIGSPVLLGNGAYTYSPFNTLAALSGGRFVAVNHIDLPDTKTRIQAKIFTTDGANTPVCVSTINVSGDSAAYASYKYPCVVPVKDGGFVVAWNHAGTTKIKRFDSNGNAVGIAVSVSSSNSYFCICNIPGQNSIVVFFTASSDQYLYGQRYSLDAPSSPVADGAALSVDYYAPGIKFPRAVGLAGEFVSIAYYIGAGVVSVYDCSAAGTPVIHGSRLTFGWPASYPWSVAPHLKNGNFVITQSTAGNTFGALREYTNVPAGTTEDGVGNVDWDYRSPVASLLIPFI